MEGGFRLILIALFPKIRESGRTTILKSRLRTLRVELAVLLRETGVLSPKTGVGVTSGRKFFGVALIGWVQNSKYKRGAQKKKKLMPGLRAPVGWSNYWKRGGGACQTSGEPAILGIKSVAVAVRKDNDGRSSYSRAGAKEYQKNHQATKTGGRTADSFHVRFGVPSLHEKNGGTPSATKYSKPKKGNWGGFR